jgi:uncharacterized membrane protein YidH (DUF202 family)
MLTFVLQVTPLKLTEIRAGFGVGRTWLFFTAQSVDSMVESVDIAFSLESIAILLCAVHISIVVLGSSPELN